MGLLSKIKKKKEPEQENPWEKPQGPQLSTKFEAFKGYAAQKAAAQPALAPRDEVETENLNAAPERYEETYEEYKLRKKQEEQQQRMQQRLYAAPPSGYAASTTTAELNEVRKFDFENDPDDLNALPEEVDQQDRYDDFTLEQTQEQTQELDSDEEAIKDIKGELSFTRDKSLAATQEIIRMGREAEVLAQNTMGMLGLQLERLLNTEQNMRVGSTGQKIAHEHAKTLQTVSNVFQAPSNPFLKGRRLAAKEDRQMAEIIKDQEQRSREQAEMNALERRVKTVLGAAGYGYGSSAKGYRTRDEALELHRQYLFDGEDEAEKDKELEIGRNMDEIGDIAKRLRRHAELQNEELTRQEKRLADMQYNMGNLTVGVKQTDERLKRITRK